MYDEKEIKKRLRKRGFTYIALWQFIVFIMLLCIVWVNEILDLPSLFFSITQGSANIFRGCILTAGVIVCAIVTVGNTYVQQKHIIKGLLIVCSSCQKIRIGQNAWEEMNYYLQEHSLAAFSHGFCPECYKKFEQSVMETQRAGS